MAVYTKLNFQDIHSIFRNYPDTGNLVSFEGIVEGIDNSNFIITTTKDEYILTVFEKRIDPKDLPFFMNLKFHLAKKEVCCPRPIANYEGGFITEFNGKFVSIVTFLEGTTLKARKDGYYDNITVDHCYEVGKNSALLHNAVADFEAKRENDLGILGWQKLLNKMAVRVDEFTPGLKSEIDGYINFLEKNWNKNLPQGVAHLDIFPDNVFFDRNKKLTGIIDFYFSANDLFIYDLAIVIVAWCFDENNKFYQEKLDAVLKGYQEIREISKDEMDFLNTALIGACLRFLLTRLYDYFFTLKDSIVNIKNPDEYLQKIRFFSNRK